MEVNLLKPYSGLFEFKQHAWFETTQIIPLHLSYIFHQVFCIFVALIPQFKDVSSTKRLQDNLDKASPEISEDSESNCHKNVSCHYQGVINELNDKNFSNDHVNQSDSKLKCSDNQSNLSDIDMSIIDENIGQSKVQSMHTSFFVHNLSSAKGNENKKVQQQNRFMDQSKKNKFNVKKKVLVILKKTTTRTIVLTVFAM